MVDDVTMGDADPERGAYRCTYSLRYNYVFPACNLSSARHTAFYSKSVLAGQISEHTNITQSRLTLQLVRLQSVGVDSSASEEQLPRLLNGR